MLMKFIEIKVKGEKSKLINVDCITEVREGVEGVAIIEVMGVGGSRVDIETEHYYESVLDLFTDTLGVRTVEVIS